MRHTHMLLLPFQVLQHDKMSAHVAEAFKYHTYLLDYRRVESKGRLHYRVVGVATIYRRKSRWKIVSKCAQPMYANDVFRG